VTAVERDAIRVLIENRPGLNVDALVAVLQAAASQDDAETPDRPGTSD
jgi:hypothetical protein